LAKRPVGPFGELPALAPGGRDADRLHPLDVLVLLDAGVPGRVELLRMSRSVLPHQRLLSLEGHCDLIGQAVV
jgi:hypothetical protein